MQLEETQKEDFRFIYKLICEFFKMDLNVTYLELESFEKYMIKLFKPGSINYTIFQNDKRIGYVHLVNNEIGCFLLPKYRGMGIALTACKEMMKLNPRMNYFATINNQNKASISFILKLGFKPKGIVYVFSGKNLHVEGF